MIRNLTFAGVNLRTTYGVRISGSGTYDSPVRTYEVVSIPGRDGDLILPEKRFENVTITYPAFIEKNFEENFAALRAFLLSKVGYQKLSDSYHPDEYRMAYFPGALLPEMTRTLKEGRFDLSFVCKPQRFLVAGDSYVTMESSGTFVNPTLYPCKPLIICYKPSGATQAEITINDTTISLTYGNLLGGFRIDCENMNFLNNTGSSMILINDRVTMNKLDFPVLYPGENGITLTTGISSIRIYPHTYTI